MTIRERVLKAYGGCCAWCQGTYRLEIDHVHGDGAQHRAQIKVKLETWLWRQYQENGYYEPGVQILCKDCHDSKSGRRFRMPAGQGWKAFNTSLPIPLYHQLTVLAERPEFGAINRVIEAAMLTLLEGHSNEVLVQQVQHQIAVLQATLTKQLQDNDALVGQVATRQPRLEQEIKNLRDRLDAMDAARARETNALTQAFDRLAAQLTEAMSKKRSLW